MKNRKENLQKIKMDYRVEYALNFLYLFEDQMRNCFENCDNIIELVREIEELLQPFLFYGKKFDIDEIIDYELYIVGYNCNSK